MVLNKMLFFIHYQIIDPVILFIIIIMLYIIAYIIAAITKEDRGRRRKSD